jgi:hypothetical protein
MVLTESLREEFETVVRPVMEFLADARVFHPHFKIVIEINRAELLESSASFATEDYVTD